MKYKLERFVEGDWKRTAFSAETLNEIIDALNSLLASEGRGGIKIIKSDAKFIWEATFSGSAATGSTPQPSSGSIINNNWYCLCRYA